MSNLFPSIWLEYTDKDKKHSLISGFYREWSHGGFENDEAQCNGLEIYINQMEKASAENLLLRVVCKMILTNVVSVTYIKTSFAFVLATKIPLVCYCHCALIANSDNFDLS